MLCIDDLFEIHCNFHSSPIKLKILCSFLFYKAKCACSKNWLSPKDFALSTAPNENRASYLSRATIGFLNSNYTRIFDNFKKKINKKKVKILCRVNVNLKNQ